MDRGREGGSGEVRNEWLGEIGEVEDGRGVSLSVGGGVRGGERKVVSGEVRLKWLVGRGKEEGEFVMVGR